MARKNNHRIGNPKRGVRLDEVGGETVTVSVHVNGILKYSKTASIISVNGNSHGYKTTQGERINHSRSLGVNSLAKRLL